MEWLAVARRHGNGGAEGVGVRLPPSFSQDLTDALCSASRTARCCRRRAFAEPAAAAAAIPAIASNGSQRLSMYMEHPFVRDHQGAPELAAMERRLDECADRVGAPAHLRKLNDTKLSRGRPRACPVIEQSRASIPQARLLGNVPGDEGPLAVARHVSSVTLSAILVALRMSCRPPLAAAISDAGVIVPAAQPEAGRNEVRSRPLRPHAQHCASPRASQPARTAAESRLIKSLASASFKRRQQDSSIRSRQAYESLGPACPLHEMTERV